MSFMNTTEDVDKINAIFSDTSKFQRITQYTNKNIKKFINRNIEIVSNAVLMGLKSISLLVNLKPTAAPYHRPKYLSKH